MLPESAGIIENGPLWLELWPFQVLYKFARPSAQGVSDLSQDSSILRFIYSLLIDLSITRAREPRLGEPAAQNGDPCRILAEPPWRFCRPLAAPGLTTIDFLPPQRPFKNLLIFGTPQNRPRGVSKSTLGRPRTTLSRF